MAVKAKLTPMAGALASATMILGLSAAPAHGAGNQDRPANAQGAATTGDQAPAARSATTGMQATQADMRASKLMGKDVRNAQGQELGEIKDMIVDLERNRVHYVILERGGVLGVGGKAIALPVSRLEGRAGDELAVNLTEQQMKDAPGLERDVQWSDPRTWDNIGQYYHRTLGMPGNRESIEGGRFQRASDVLGKDVNDPTGKDVGDIEDLVVDLANGSIHYAVLEFDRAWNPNDKLVALPLSAIQSKEGSDRLTINMTREQLTNAPSFDSNAWPDPGDRAFRDRVAGFHGGTTTGMEQSGSRPATGSDSATPSGLTGARPSTGAASPGAAPSAGSGSGASGSADTPTSTTGPTQPSSASPGSGPGSQPR